MQVKQYKMQRSGAVTNKVSLKVDYSILLRELQLHFEYLKSFPRWTQLLTAPPKILSNILQSGANEPSNYQFIKYHICICLNLIKE